MVCPCLAIGKRICNPLATLSELRAGKKGPSLNVRHSFLSQSQPAREISTTISLTWSTWRWRAWVGRWRRRRWIRSWSRLAPSIPRSRGWRTTRSPQGSLRSSRGSGSSPGDGLMRNLLRQRFFDRLCLRVMTCGCSKCSMLFLTYNSLCCITGLEVYFDLKLEMCLLSI